MNTIAKRGIKKDQLAAEIWGDRYAAIPKSVFAYIAWHLANVASGEADHEGAAEKRFFEEWEALLPHGLQRPTARAKGWKK